MELDKAKRYALLSEIGCIVCRHWLEVVSPPEIHHIRCRGGMGLRAKDNETIPLCPTHHRMGPHGIAYHAGRTAFENAFATEEELLELTNKLITEALENG